MADAIQGLRRSARNQSQPADPNPEQPGQEDGASSQPNSSEPSDSGEPRSSGLGPPGSDPPGSDPPESDPPGSDPSSPQSVRLFNTGYSAATYPPNRHRADFAYRDLNDKPSSWARRRNHLLDIYNELGVPIPGSDWLRRPNGDIFMKNGRRQRADSVPGLLTRLVELRGDFRTSPWYHHWARQIHPYRQEGFRNTGRESFDELMRRIDEWDSYTVSWDSDELYSMLEERGLITEYDRANPESIDECEMRRRLLEYEMGHAYRNCKWPHTELPRFPSNEMQYRGDIRNFRHYQDTGGQRWHGVNMARWSPPGNGHCMFNAFAYAHMRHLGRDIRSELQEMWQSSLEPGSEMHTQRHNGPNSVYAKVEHENVLYGGAPTANILNGTWSFESNSVEYGTEALLQLLADCYNVTVVVFAPERKRTPTIASSSSDVDPSQSDNGQDPNENDTRTSERFHSVESAPPETPSPGSPPSENPPFEEPPGSSPGSRLPDSSPWSRPPGSNPPGSNPPGSDPPGSDPPGSDPPGSEPSESEPSGNEPPGSDPSTGNPPGSNTPISESPSNHPSSNNAPSTSPLGSEDGLLDADLTNPNLYRLMAIRGSYQTVQRHVFLLCDIQARHYEALVPDTERLYTLYAHDMLAANTPAMLTSPQAPLYLYPGVDLSANPGPIPLCPVPGDLNWDTAHDTEPKWPGRS
jgi:hypothetical protein